MAFCRSCGKELGGDSKFCNHCGTPVEEKVEAVDSPDPFKTVVKDATAYGAVNLEQLPEGHVIDDRYEVKAKLGQGGFGAVYRVYDRKMECEKALKVLPEAVASDRAAMVGLKKEAVTMAKLNHPGIVHVYDFCDTGSIKYIDMEFVEGASLSDALVDAPEGRFDESHATRLARQLAEGLAYAHTQGVIHKDIKAQNILITKDGTPKITDFGISETVKSSMSRIANSSSSGTLVYMAPEQIRGRDVGRESDIYSFGALLYELLSGHPPFYKGAIEHQILSEPVPPLEGVSDSLSSLVIRCLEKEYTDRFRSFEEVLAALDGKDVPKESKPVVPPESKPKAAGKPVWMAAAAVVVLVVAAGVYGLVGKGDTQPATEPVAVAAVPEPEPVKAPVEPAAELPFLARQEIKITECRESISQFQNSIEAMKGRLDSGQGKDGDSLEAMLGLIKQKKVKSGELERLLEEKKNWAYTQLKKDIEVYKGLIATEEGKGLKQTAWKQLTAKYPEDAKGVVPYDTVALLDGCRLTVITEPEGAAVKILNIGPAYTPGMKLKPGRYELIARPGKDLQGYSDTRKTVTLGRGGHTKETLKLTAMGRLYVKTKPSDVKVELTGVKGGYTPGMYLKQGTYKVKLSNAAGFSKKVTVQVKAGQTTKRTVAMANKNSLGMEFVYIKPGSFMMGSPSGELKRDDDETQHEVTLTKGFYLQTTEVTVGQWRAFVKETGYKSRAETHGGASVMKNNKWEEEKGLYWDNPGYEQTDACPVTCVSWNDVQAFISWLNSQPGEGVYRLPSEAQWEYACRAGTTTPYAFGNCISTDQVNYDGNYPYSDCSKGQYRDKPMPVASLAANPWGLYDMHGNVWEHCHGWVSDYPRRGVTDPIGVITGSDRARRGGSWWDPAKGMRSANRGVSGPDDRNVYSGFRLARML